jgi:hypothetical protein
MYESRTLVAKKEKDDPMPERGNQSPTDTPRRDRGSDRGYPDHRPGEGDVRERNPPKRGGDDPTPDW